MSTNKRTSLHVSLIVPVFNETTRLSVGLREIYSYLKKQSYRWEVIVVDDGSVLPVEDVVRRLPPGFTVLRLPENAGKGAAIGFGVAHAKGKYIVFTDIDLSVPISELKTMLSYLQRSPVVIASRRLTTSAIVVHQGSVRELSGRIFTALSNLLCNTQLTDVTCGFKGFEKKAATTLFTRRRINRWVFDTEILFLARKLHIPIAEMPVNWSNKPGSKVVLLDSFGSLTDLLRIRWYNARGLYR